MKKFLFLPFLLAVLLVISACSQSPKSSANLELQADIVRGSSAPLGPVCADVTQLAAGETAVPRVKVIDPSTGKELSGNDTKSVVWHLEDGQSFPMSYAGHGGNKTNGTPPTDYFWTAGWTIPANYHTGTVKWWVTAESKDGRTGRYDPINMAASMLTIIQKPAK